MELRKTVRSGPGSLISNKKARAEWIKQTKDYISFLPSFGKIFLFVIYINGSFTNLHKHMQKLNYTYAHCSKMVNLLKDMGMINDKKIGRMHRYTLTRLGRGYVKKYLEVMR